MRKQWLCQKLTRIFIPSTNTGLKKPYNLVNQLIRKYSKRNQVILDAFSGSGISLIEALNSKRKAIGIDINPSAIFISKSILQKNEINKVEKEFEKIQQDCKEKIDNLYKVKRNGHSFIGTHFVWSNGKLVEIWHHDKKLKKIKPNLGDKRNANSFSYSKIKYFFPKDRLFHNPRINASAKMRVCDLFTPRNTYALSILLHRINKIKNRNLRDLFRFSFSSALGQSSKMVFVVKNHLEGNGKKKRRKHKQVGIWVIGYWIPKEHFEMNVWNCFERRSNKIINAKKQQNSHYETKFVKDFRGLRTGNLLLINKSALKGLKKIPKNSIDYVISDPPHGDRLPYLELSMMWNSWLKNKVNYKDEIIISSAKGRNKDSNNYNKLLGKTMKEIVRVLKPNRYVTLMFNTHDSKTWSDFITNYKNAGLKIEDFEIMNYSRNSVVQENKNGGLKHDFLLTFKKIN